MPPTKVVLPQVLVEACIRQLMLFIFGRGLTRLFPLVSADMSDLRLFCYFVCMYYRTVICGWRSARRYTLGSFLLFGARLMIHDSRFLHEQSCNRKGQGALKVQSIVRLARLKYPYLDGGTLGQRKRKEHMPLF
jgi:hypothetical protein